MTTDFVRLLDYDRWANGETLAALRALTDPPRRAMEIFAHIVAVHHLFLTRIHGQPPPIVWPDPADYDFAERMHSAYIHQAPKGRLMSAQGIALGKYACQRKKALKGRASD